MSKKHKGSKDDALSQDAVKALMPSVVKHADVVHRQLSAVKSRSEKLVEHVQAEVAEINKMLAEIA